ncbi:hypothetical protein BsWGS_03425 [Bradybaena similaris]
MKIYKVAFVGSTGVGKTAIALETKRSFYRGTILALRRKSMTVDSVVIAIDVLDTSGSDEYVSVRDEAIKASDGFVVIYSIISSDSFKRITQMNHDIKALKGTDVIPVVLVGNKLDLESDRQVPHVEGELLARDWGCPFLETFVDSERLRAVYETVVHEMNKSRSILWDYIDESQEVNIDPEERECRCVIL